MKRNFTKKLTLSAIMIAVATVLSLYAVFKLPNGGSVTVASMVPISVIAFMLGTKWGVLSALVYALLQMVIGFYPPPAASISSFVIVILFDYIIAFGVIGLAGMFYRILGKKPWAMPVSVAIVCFLRFICHFISGVAIWKIYAPEGQSPAVYSLLYNGSYMSLELIITTAVTALLSGTLVKQTENF